MIVEETRNDLTNFDSVGEIISNEIDLLMPIFFQVFANDTVKILSSTQKQAAT